MVSNRRRSIKGGSVDNSGLNDPTTPINVVPYTNNEHHGKIAALAKSDNTSGTTDPSSKSGSTTTGTNATNTPGASTNTPTQVSTSGTGGSRRRRRNKRSSHKRSSHKRSSRKRSSRKRSSKKHKRRSHKKVKRGGRASAGIIGAALSAALVPFGLMAAQKKIQQKLPVVKPNKTMKRKTKRSRRKSKSSKK